MGRKDSSDNDDELPGIAYRIVEVSDGEFEGWEGEGQSGGVDERGWIEVYWVQWSKLCIIFPSSLVLYVCFNSE